MARPNNENLSLTGNNLSIQDVLNIARLNRHVSPLMLGTITYQRVAESAQWVQDAVNAIGEANDADTVDAYYGINTGFGSHAGGKPLHDPELTRQLTRKLVMSHSTGVGDYLDQEVVRAAMLIRVNTLSKGYSGIRPDVLNLLIEMLNRDIVPAIPEMGSLGASGDLAPLSHLALTISKSPSSMAEDDTPGFGGISGEAFVRAEDGSYKLVSGAEAMTWDGMDHRVTLEAKEGLALTNGTTFSAAIGVLALTDAENLLRHAEATTALSLEALQGYRDAFLPQLHALRGHPGQIASAANILDLVQGSGLVDPGDIDHDPGHPPPQDAYSLRCTPQVFGAIRETLAHIRGMLGREINAATDNPLIFFRPEDGLDRNYKVISGGNFHGEPIAFAMDHLSIALTELGSISERRSFWMTSPSKSRGLPSMLVAGDDTQMDSGLMISQYVAASLVSKCKTLAHPDSVDSIPSSDNQEDHVSMSMNAALHARQIVGYVADVIAVELLTAVTAIRHRLNGLRRDPEDIVPLDVDSLGEGTQVIWATLSDHAPELLSRPINRDVILYPYLRQARQVIDSGVLVDALARSGFRSREVRSRLDIV